MTPNQLNVIAAHRILTKDCVLQRALLEVKTRETVSLKLNPLNLKAEQLNNNIEAAAAPWEQLVLHAEQGVEVLERLGNETVIT
jgi:hypothetical protein